MNLIRFKTLLYREIIRFLKVINQTILSPVLSSMLYLAVFGVILGGQMQHEGSYIAFIVPGVIVMEIMMAAYSNTSSSLFLSRYLHMIDHILVTPITYTELVFAYLFGGVFRGALVGAFIGVVSLFFSPLHIAHPLALLFFVFGIGLVFSGIGIIVALWSEEFEDLSIVTTYLITPFTFLGGVFYSVKLLPPALLAITQFNPFFYLIDGFRWSIIGQSEGNIYISILLTVGLAISLTLANILLFKRGYKIKQ